jgi:hypothetical protein
MRSSKVSTLCGVGMIVGSIPCTLASFLVWYLTIAIQEARAAGQTGGFDVIGLLMMSYFAFLIALGSCVVGLLYFGYAMLKEKESLKRWHVFGILYSLIQVTIPLVYVATPK